MGVSFRPTSILCQYRCPGNTLRALEGICVGSSNNPFLPVVFQSSLEVEIIAWRFCMTPTMDPLTYLKPPSDTIWNPPSAACMRYRPLIPTNKMEVLLPLAPDCMFCLGKINDHHRGTLVITTQWPSLEKYGLAGLLFMSNDVCHNTRHDSAPAIVKTQSQSAEPLATSMSLYNRYHNLNCTMWN